jgi:AraC family transcriptional regulator
MEPAVSVGNMSKLQAAEATCGLEERSNGPERQEVELMLTNSLPTNVGLCRPFVRNPPRSSQAGVLLSLDERPGLEGHYERPSHAVRLTHDRPAIGAIDGAVEVVPSDAVKRHAATWDGVTAEIVQATKHESIEYRFRAPRHLLAVYEQGVRRDGDTLVEGLPRSALRELKGKLTFVPAGHEYYERHEPRVLTRVVYFYLDPDRMPIHPASELANAALAPLAPRLFFENAALWDTALKLKRLVEGAPSDNKLYFEALGVVLAHELVRLNAGVRRIDAPVRGGLAPWQQRIVTTYIEEHLGEQISLAKLAQLVGLSTYYFCRAFKQSIGLPPHRYHNNRRIEQAKILLSKPAPSVTEIGLTVGFSETSSFTTAFRKATGLTPTAFHRSLT